MGAEMLGGIIVALVTFVLTYLGTTAIQKAEAGRVTMTHEKIHHKHDPRALVEEAIASHVNNCSAPEDLAALRVEIEGIKGALVFLVAKMGGNPKELGLL